MDLNTLALQPFFPQSLEVVSVESDESRIDIGLKSHSKSCVCPYCGAVLTKKRATYVRQAQDLPILGKKVMLSVRCYEYQCNDCSRPVAENLGEFLEPASRLTERCKELIIRLALETSCEGASRILKELGISYSGDSIIRLLLKEAERMPQQKTSPVIGVDDFAYKKGHTYGTVIVDGTTHRPLALLDGRDGKALRAWLKENKHVKVVTRDRASAYARVLQEELPDAIQVADRFHLHENLMQAVKKALDSTIPNSISCDLPCPEQAVTAETDEERGKKRAASEQ